MSTVNAEEISHFTAQAAQWWNETGPFKPLHKINPVRLSFLRQELQQHLNLSFDKPTPLEGLSVLDIGCGGGLLCEPLARLGATVIGIDAGAENIAVATVHAREMGLDISYTCTTSEDLASTGQTYDIVTALEIVEHVANVDLFLKSCCALVKPGGMLFVSTLNKTLKSYALGIIAAEYLLRWVPKGTHQWGKFLEPFDIHTRLSREGVIIQNIKGITYAPLTNAWSLSTDLDVNYILSAVKP